jgi:hypothetical protein
MARQLRNGCAFVNHVDDICIRKTFHVLLVKCCATQQYHPIMERMNAYCYCYVRQGTLQLSNKGTILMKMIDTPALCVHLYRGLYTWAGISGTAIDIHRSRFCEIAPGCNVPTNVGASMRNTGITDRPRLAILSCLLTPSPSACSSREGETKTTPHAERHPNLAQNSLSTRISNHKPLLKTSPADTPNATTVHRWCWTGTMA